MVPEPEPKKIEIEQETLNYLNTSRKWTMFLAVIGYIFLGLFIILGLLAGTFLSAFKSGETGLGIPDSLTFIAIPISAIALFFPGFFLFRYSKYMSKAVSEYDKKALHNSLRYLKNYFAYIGVLTIILLVIYVGAVILAGLSTTLFNGPVQ